MFRILKAFAWLRWRMLVNSLEKTGSRDTLERFSMAIEKIGPLIAAVLLIPSAVVLGALAVAAGYTLGTGGSPMPLTAMRYILAAVPLLAVIGPFFLPAADRTNPVRLLLLPIPRSTLYVAQASATLGDPWNILLVPLVAGLPIGLAATGALAPALATLAAAALLVAVVVGLSALTTSVVHLVVRDRRRGELMMLLFIMIIPVMSLLPSLAAGRSSRDRRQDRPVVVPGWVATAGAKALALYPSELFVSQAQAATAGQPARAAAALAGLAASAFALHGIGIIAFRRVLESPGTTGARRSSPMRSGWGARLPGLSTGASGVALVHFRLALRTPRGRSIFLSPLIFFLIFAVMMYRGSGTVDFGPFHFGSGLSLATFSASMCLISILPIAWNQFAVDKAGLTMALLSPLTDDELLAGKAAGNTLITALPASVCIAAALLVFGGGSPALWVALVLGLISVSVLVAPVAAICSASLPRTVDMNSIGRGSNAHGAAGFIGLISYAAAGAPAILLTLLATRVLDRPSLAPVLLAVWCAAAYGIARLLFIPARRIFAARRENLAMIA